jgi:hypothetical protein
VVGVGSVTLLLLVVGGSWTLRSLANWQQAQLRHQLPFSKIELDPPAPPWILGGSQALLERVRDSAGCGPNVEVLSEDLSKLRDAFAGHSPWVQRVRRIERRYPNRLIVRVDYREPVARLGTERSRSLYLDAEGIVLPAAEIDDSAAGALIALSLVSLPVVDIRAGQAMTVSPGTGAAATNAPIKSAARLAAFLRNQISGRGKNPPPFKIDAIYVDARSISLAVVARPVAMILWETSGRRSNMAPLGDDEKWARLLAWADAHDISKITGDEWLEIGKAGVLVRPR